MIEQNSSGLGDNYAALRDINIYQESKTISSNFSHIINILGSQLVEDESTQLSEPPDIEEKILHNNVIYYRGIIDEYGIFVGKLTAIYNEFDTVGTNKTNNTLSNIRLQYLKVKAELWAKFPNKKPLEIIRENADFIFQEVEKRLLNEIKVSSNITESYDAINVSLQVIMIDAFFRCKILENPKTNVTPEKH
jgi:hypothetical protein